MDFFFFKDRRNNSIFYADQKIFAFPVRDLAFSPTLPSLDFKFADLLFLGTLILRSIYWKSELIMDLRIMKINLFCV